ncbi:MAG: hypothetical protein NVSMB63_15000 [Sediminibacterium sp.]
MKRLIIYLEEFFEKITNYAVKIFGHSFTFLCAIVLVTYWFFNKEFRGENIHDTIRDIITGITFLSFFIIQKYFNRFSLSIHLKLNELLASHDRASNRMVNVEERSEKEMSEISEKFSELVQRAEESNEKDAYHSIEHVMPEEEENKKPAEGDK